MRKLIIVILGIVLYLFPVSSSGKDASAPLIDKKKGGVKIRTWKNNSALLIKYIAVYLEGAFLLKAGTYKLTNTANAGEAAGVFEYVNTHLAEKTAVFKSPPVGLNEKQIVMVANHIGEYTKLFSDASDEFVENAMIILDKYSGEQAEIESALVAFMTVCERIHEITQIWPKYEQEMQK
jgi:hypothetical protein